MVIFSSKMYVVFLFVSFFYSLSGMQEAALKNFKAKIEARDLVGVKAVVEGGYIQKDDLFEGSLRIIGLKSKETLHSDDYCALDCIENYLLSVEPDDLRRYQENARARASSAQSSSASVSMESSASSSASAPQASSIASIMDSRFKTPLDDILRDVLSGASTQAADADSFAAVTSSQAQSVAEVTSSACVEKYRQEDAVGPIEQNELIVARPYQSGQVDARTVHGCRHCANWCVATLWMIFMLLLPQRCG